MVKLYDPALSDAIKERLSQLEDKPKLAAKVQAKAVIEGFRQAARQAMAKGYTLDEILAIAQQAGLEVSRSTLKTYLRGGKTRKPKPAVRRAKPTPRPSAARPSAAKGDGAAHPRDTTEPTERGHAGFNEDN